MIHDPWGLFSAALNFAGGAVLTLDALTIRRRIRAASGTRKLQEILTKLGRPDVLMGPDAKPLNSDAAIDLWLSTRTLEWTRVGFALMTAGFLIDAMRRVGL